jgi:ABC-2 type transport system permease protein
MLVDELKRTFRRPRNLVVLGLIALVPVLLGVVVKTLGHSGGNGGGPPFFSQLTQNPVFLSLVALTTMETFLIPLAVSLIAGDSFSGDASSGALRYLLVAPAGRGRLLLVKVFSALLYTVVAVLLIAVVGGVTGAVLFPIGPIVTLSGTTVTNLGGVGLTLEAALLVAVSMFSIVGVGVFVSTLTDSSAAASAVAVAVAVVSEILGQIPQLVHIRPILPSTYWGSFVDLFRSPQVLHNVKLDLLEQVVWLVAALSAAWFNFRGKDIFS